MSSHPPQQPEPQQYAPQGQPQYAQQQPAPAPQQAPQQQQPAPAPQQQYAQQQYASQPQAQQAAYPAARGGEAGRLNLLGVIALGLQVLLALSNAFLPLLYRQVAMSGDFSVISVVMPVTQGVMQLIIVGLAVAGLLQRSAPRLRWTAIGALVSGGLSLLSMAGSLLGNWIASALPY